jgi:hypothetical protein
MKFESSITIIALLWLSMIETPPLFLNSRNLHLWESQAAPAAQSAAPPPSLIGMCESVTLTSVNNPALSWKSKAPQRLSSDGVPNGAHSITVVTFRGTCPGACERQMNEPLFARHREPQQRATKSDSISKSAAPP